MWNPFKSKNKITLQQFFDAVMEVAKEQGENYISVKVELGSHNDLELSGYINHNTWCSGKTIQEVIDKLRNKQEPVSPIKEISF